METEGEVDDLLFVEIVDIMSGEYMMETYEVIFHLLRYSDLQIVFDFFVQEDRRTY